MIVASTILKLGAVGAVLLLAGRAQAAPSTGQVADNQTQRGYFRPPVGFNARSVQPVASYTPLPWNPNMPGHPPAKTGQGAAVNLALGQATGGIYSAVNLGFQAVGGPDIGQTLANSYANGNISRTDGTGTITNAGRNIEITVLS